MATQVLYSTDSEGSDDLDMWIKKSLSHLLNARIWCHMMSLKAENIQSSKFWCIKYIGIVADHKKGGKIGWFQSLTDWPVQILL